MRIIHATRHREDDSLAEKLIENILLTIEKVCVAIITKSFTKVSPNAVAIGRLKASQVPQETGSDGVPTGTTA